MPSKSVLAIQPTAETLLNGCQSVVVLGAKDVELRLAMTGGVSNCIMEHIESSLLLSDSVSYCPAALAVYLRRSRMVIGSYVLVEPVNCCCDFY